MSNAKKRSRKLLHPRNIPPKTLTRAFSRIDETACLLAFKELAKVCRTSRFVCWRFLSLAAASGASLAPASGRADASGRPFSGRRSEALQIGPRQQKMRPAGSRSGRRLSPGSLASKRHVSRQPQASDGRSCRCLSQALSAGGLVVMKSRSNRANRMKPDSFQRC